MKKKKKHTLLKGVAWTAFTGVAAAHLYNGFTDSNVLRYVDVPVYSPKITEELDGYQIAFVTDVHHTPNYQVGEIAEKLNQISPDLLLLGGDFSEVKAKSWRAIQLLSQVQTVDGIYGVDGNHDDYQSLYDAMELYGIQVLDNQGIELRPGLYLGGIQDYQYRLPSIYEAMKDSKTTDFRILLSHNPDVTMVQNLRQVDLAICGHIHGGEVSFFGKFAPALLLPFTPELGITDYNQRFAKGWGKGKDGTPVYTSNGVGKHAPMRIYVPPEVTIFTLKKEN